MGPASEKGEKGVIPPPTEAEGVNSDIAEGENGDMRA